MKTFKYFEALLLKPNKNYKIACYKKRKIEQIFYVV